jgi:phosphatidylglycerol---prolipoprotein diacylglyceryl transferase
VKRSKQKKFDGELILTYTLLYAVGRFFLEYLRGDIDRGFLFNGLFSTSQFIALILGLFSLVIMMMRSRTSQQLPAA